MVRKRGKNVDFCIYEQLLKCLVNGGKIYQMIQMIRSDIFKDSKQLACLLLSLRNQYKPAAQLGLDMLQRLDCLSDIIESLSLDSDGSQKDLLPNCIESTCRYSESLSKSLEVSVEE